MVTQALIDAKQRIAQELYDAAVRMLALSIELDIQTQTITEPMSGQSWFSFMQDHINFDILCEDIANSMEFMK